MRLLVKCNECHRQYDATGRKIGSRFRCHCGEAVTVEQPRGHDARVVRCSSCGAAREKGAAECGFCHSDFTLHEQDRDTVCPSCLTRVSDAARYCHHCGMHLVAEQVAGEATSLECPACQNGAQLQSRRLGQMSLAVMECDLCAGLWLGSEVFAALTRKASAVGSKADPLLLHLLQTRGPRAKPPVAGSSAAATGRSGSQGSSFYRPCPVCQDMMPRRNYGQRSGVIVDLCREHGVWFDADELPRILTWMRAGGKNDGILSTPPPPPVQTRSVKSHSDRYYELRYLPQDTTPPFFESYLLRMAYHALETLVRMFLDSRRF